MCVFQVTKLEESVAAFIAQNIQQKEHQNSFLEWGVSPEHKEALLLNSALGRRKKKKPSCKLRNISIYLWRKHLATPDIMMKGKLQGGKLRKVDESCKMTVLSLRHSSGSHFNTKILL